MIIFWWSLIIHKIIHLNTDMGLSMLNIRLVIFVFLFPTLVQAGMFDDFVNESTQAADETVNKIVDSATKANDNSMQDNQTSNKTGSSSGKGDYITIEDIPTVRRPATFGTLGLARLRYDQGWLTDKNLLKATQASISCQQDYIKYGSIRGNGCMGEYLSTGTSTHFIKLAPVFNDDEIKDRNPKFAANELKDRMKPALLEMARHLPPEFGDTVSWRGTYDFNQGILHVDIRGYEAAPRNIVNKLPTSIKHLDLRNPNRANFDGTKGEYYRLKVWTPFVQGVYALAFDRSLGHGQVSLPASEAEKLFKNSSKDYVSGLAVVEFRVTDTAGEAALATLEQVKLLSAGNKIDLATVKPFLNVPASAFPKIELKKEQLKETTVKPAEEVNVSPPMKLSEEPDPLARIKQGNPYGPDIVGLKLGMTIDQADQVIRKRKEPVEVINGIAPAPFAQAILYILKPGDEAITLMTLASPVGERIAGYVRTVSFERDSAPTEIAITSSVEDKYGVPFYSYNAKGSHFDRRWYTNWEGNPVSEEEGVSQKIGKCERAAKTDSGLKVWLTENGQPYHWFSPGATNWNSPWVLKPGDPQRTQNVHRCGPTVIANYQANSGQPIGPSLTLSLFDGAWIMRAVEKQNAAEAAQGAKNLDL